MSIIVIHDTYLHVFVAVQAIPTQLYRQVGPVRLYIDMIV
jgi:hypothetical protein